MPSLFRDSRQLENVATLLVPMPEREFADLGVDFFAGPIDTE